MKLRIARIALLIVTVVSLGSCASDISRLMSSGDHEGMYKLALELFKQKRYNKTALLLQESGHHFTGTEREDSVAYFLATSYYKQGDFQVAGDLFNEFRRNYGRSVFLEDVEYMYAMSFYYSSLPSNRDQSLSIKAISAITEYLGRYPNSVKKDKLNEHIVELTQRMHDKSYQNAKLYYDIGQYKSAVVALQNSLDKYPDSRHREMLMFYILKSHYLYAKNSLDHLQRDRFVTMLDAYYTFTAEFPESKYRKEADEMQDDAKKILAKYNIDKEDGTKKE